MTRHASHRTSVTSLVGAAILDVDGKTFGRIHELAVSPLEDAGHIYGMLVRKPSESRETPLSLVLITELESAGEHQLQLRAGATILSLAKDETYLLLERDLLDQQIIDINGRKVVRVNDVDLVWEAPHEGSDRLRLRISEVEVGLRGAARRLLKGLPPSAVERVAARFRPVVIPWDFVDLIDRDPARRVKLRVEQDKLSSMHPSDLADILEELAPAERQAVFNSLDEEVAAEALKEVDPKLQQTLIDSLNSEQIAGIVEEMDPGAAADLLSELSEERSEAILDEMDPEERQEVEELLEFAGDSAAGRMTTEYLSLPLDANVNDALVALRGFEGDLESITDIYLLDDQGKIAALIPLVHMLLAETGSALKDLPHGHIVSCKVDANGRKVAELFDKYNLRALPVLDEEGRIVGVVHADQIIALLRAKT